uniref:DUF5641 domain-containing protein n=1 Tax=Angiostrongylus cantonensis TaxID=6313 RepID=A0A0K0DN51_ANGCA
MMDVDLCRVNCVEKASYYRKIIATTIVFYKRASSVEIVSSDGVPLKISVERRRRTETTTKAQHRVYEELWTSTWIVGSEKDEEIGTLPE